MENKPDFLIIGAAKSGTTSIFHYLNQHPDIYIPEVKECRFFSQLPKNFNGLGAEFFPNSGITDEKEYFKLFKGYADKVCGDISNDYLYYYEESIRNIKKYLSNDVKIIIILRNPINRTYSNYMHAYRDGWEDCSFEEALEKEKNRIKNNWAWSYHYVEVGKYYNQVKTYLNNFENVKIYLFEDLKDKSDFFDNLFWFLEVDKINLEINEQFNISDYPKNRKLQNFLNKKNILKDIIKPFIPKSIRERIIKTLKNKNLEKIPIKQETREKLKDIFMKCKICNKEDKSIFNASILNKYNIKYYYCNNCGFLQTEEPYWLKEAYDESIHISDTGIMSRNLHLSKIATLIIFSFLINVKSF